MTAPQGATRPLRIVVVDDHPVVRAGIVAMLSEHDGLEVVGTGRNGAECLNLVADLAPDLVLTDLRMPVMDGVETTSRLSATPGAPPVLVLTTYDSDTDIVRAIEAGARGYLLKDAPLQTLVDAIRSAVRGEEVLAPEVAARLSARGQVARSAQLSAREIEVVALVADGLSNAAIGRRLFIGEATVKTHLLRAFAKLGVNDRTAAVSAAYREGLIRLD
ncbi:response regulator transcription factor [Allobranchiibius sp. GilTou73]|uniref:response regulator n=1 Tax=Allobranchiibius sp. GilTou73 TaxID=2904523 RepID=UPI001F29A34F|nr:response regulator transcription factor [Allobranchiibius sp. GilTou73]UIJ36051.1 response regulator transcription factor [Allobranchiibius sp. GilTou73]